MRKSKGPVIALAGVIVLGFVFVNRNASNSDSSTVQNPAVASGDQIARPHWPDEAYFYSAKGKQIASASVQKSAEEIVLAQLKSLRSNKFDPTAIAQARVLGINPLDDRNYFVYARQECDPFKAWKKVTYLHTYVFPGGIGGEYVSVRLQEPYDSLSSPSPIFVFYCNQSYKPDQSD